MKGAPVAMLPALPAVAPDEFDLRSFKIFGRIPDHPDFGIVALRGAVLVYDESDLHREGVVEGALYVRESQHPTACMDWERWLDLERDDARRSRRAQPSSPLKTRREVVQAVRAAAGDRWGLRLASGAIDGPYYEWAFGRNLVGKIVGIYRPS